MRQLSIKKTRAKTDKMFKILFISSDKFKPFRPDVKELFIKRISQLGYQIDWILQSEGDCKKSYITHWLGNLFFVGRSNNGVKIIDRLIKHICAFINELKIFKLARLNNYDVIQIKDKYLPALLAIVISKIYKTKFIFWLSYPFPEAWIYKYKVGIARYPIIYIIKGIISRFFQYHIIMKNADHIFVQSDQMEKDISKFGISTQKITPIQMGVSIKDIPLNLLSKDLLTNKKQVLYLGTMAKERRPEFIIKTFKLVIKSCPDATLFMVGDGDSPETISKLKQAAKALGIGERVIFTGFIPRLQAWKLISESMVCLSPFYPTFILNSTSPTKLIEYMALAKPVVATHHPEQKIIISKSNGGICTPWNEKAFAIAIIKLLKNPNRARQMGINGRAYVKQYRSYDIIATKVISVLEKIK